MPAGTPALPAVYGPASGTTYRVWPDGDAQGPLIILRPGQDKLPMIIKVASRAGDSLEQAGIKFETGFELIIAHRDEFPNGESSFPVEFEF